MSRILTLAALVAAVAAFPGLAAAQSGCTEGTRVLPAVVLPGNTVCAVRGSDRWQEYHQAGGDLIDYKKGPSDAVDPSKKVGTWSISNGLITYTYGAQSYVYRLCQVPDGRYRFEPEPSGDLITGATVISGQGPCT